MIALFILGVFGGFCTWTWWDVFGRFRWRSKGSPVDPWPAINRELELAHQEELSEWDREFSRLTGKSLVEERNGAVVERWMQQAAGLQGTHQGVVQPGLQGSLGSAFPQDQLRNAAGLHWQALTEAEVRELLFREGRR